MLYSEARVNRKRSRELSLRVLTLPGNKAIVVSVSKKRDLTEIALLPEYRIERNGSSRYCDCCQSMLAVPSGLCRILYKLCCEASRKPIFSPPPISAQRFFNVSIVQCQALSLLESERGNGVLL